ncbi:MAG: ferritin-like domain-containing protein [Gemmatimonadaceae bacterium]|jgi:ferritin-like metal-binding protein YciE|nr:ferritin-like domain-containing protein [Gemmatimonadaceae bacterium]
MATLATMQDLLVDELRDILGAEKMLVKALPKMEQAASNPNLKMAFRDHLQETERQIERVQRALERLGVPAQGKECKAMTGLIEEGQEMIDNDGNDAVRDAGLIIAAQRVEHYEISAYGSAIEHAELLGLNEVADLLEETLDEEKRTDEKLTALAEDEVNTVAVMAGNGGAQRNA